MVIHIGFLLSFPNMLISRGFHTSLKRMALINKSEQENFVKNGRKILGAALNYMDIVRERNIPVPKEPLLFLKPSSAYLQEGLDIVIPKVFTKVAHEVELGLIISATCKNIAVEDAMCFVGGYCLALDLTAQCALGKARVNGHPWSLGKGFDTSAPVSRFIPASEIPDPHNLELWLKVNGEMRQQGNTADLIFKIPELISYASQYMTLEPNDLILTGTPGGSALLSPGDLIECGLDGFCTLKFNVKAE